MKRERQERPEGGVASESETQTQTQIWEALSHASQAGNTSGQEEAQAESQTEATEEGDGERSRAARGVLWRALGIDVPLGRVGH